MFKLLLIGDYNNIVKSLSYYNCKDYYFYIIEISKTKTKIGISKNIIQRLKTHFGIPAFFIYSLSTISLIKTFFYYLYTFSRLLI